MVVSIEDVEEGTIQIGGRKLSIDEVRKLAQAADSSLAEAAIALLMLQNGVAVEEKKPLFEIEEEEKEVDIDTKYQCASYSDNLTTDHMVLYEDANWSTNQLMVMVRMFLAGKHDHTIAQMLKKSIDDVRSKVANMGIFINDEGRCQYKGKQRTHWNSLQKDFIKWFRDALTCDQMGFLIGRNGNSVHCKFSEIDN